VELLRSQDPEVAEAIDNELKRQMEGIELIPSENLVSKAVLEAMGSIGTNKYSEGYPGKRYYGGNEFIDVMEQIAIDRAKQLFGAEHANVQCYSGSPANMEMYYAFLEVGDKIMAMALDMGGHLTHGHKVNFSGKHYKVIHYGVDKETELLDYDAIRKQALEEKPNLILSGYTAYSREIDFQKFKEIADEVGAVCVADIAHIAGLCATGVHPNPVADYDAVSTTTHKTLRGPRGAIIMCKQEHAEKIDKAVFPGMQGGPHNHTNAAKAVAFKEALKPEFTEYSKQIVKNSRALAEELQSQGHRIVSGGTDNHLMLIDLTEKGVTGKEAENSLDECGIYCNKNTIPFDPRKPWDPSGIRVGTPVLTTRGMKESEMKEVGSFIARGIKAKDDVTEKKKIREEVRELCKNFLFYG